MLRLRLRDIPRKFQVKDYEITDFGEVVLAPEEGKKHELISIETGSGKQCEVCATQWGFYVGSSLNARMKEQGFRVGLMKNSTSKLYLVAVEKEKLGEFERYLGENDSLLVAWVDEWNDQCAVVTRAPSDSGSKER